MRILIAEDDRTSRMILLTMLEKGGHEVVATSNGAEAWQEMQQPSSPRLVILDWMMPEIDGLELVQRVRSLPTGCPPYIIMLTVRGGNDDIVTGLKAGANDYLTKPIDSRQLLARVEVGQRIVEMELLDFRRREKAQIFRVETARLIHDLQDALASKDAELRQTQAALRALKASLQILC